MNKTLKIVMILVLLLAVPGGIAAILFLKKKKNTVQTPNLQGKTVSYYEYEVGEDGNPTDDEDAGNLEFNTVALIEYLRVDKTQFYDLNPWAKSMDFIPYFTVVLVPNK